MRLPQSTPEIIWAAGFKIGPHPDSPCEQCGDRWGDHKLSAPGSPLDGGVWSCPVPRCPCTGTWDVPGAAGIPRGNAPQGTGEN